jgi:hypothetical protein
MNYPTEENGRTAASRATSFGAASSPTMIPLDTFACDRLRYELYEKAVLVSAPDSLAGHAVLLICQPLSRLAVARAGDQAWTRRQPTTGASERTPPAPGMATCSARLPRRLYNALLHLHAAHASNARTG